MNAQRKIMRKLLGQPATSIPNNEIDATHIESPRLRPSASQSTRYKADAPIACLDKSPDGTRVVIAGATVFKILKIDGSTITEDIDLRAIIVSYAPTHDPSAAAPDQLNIRAVKWSHGKFSTIIFTASGNGKITAYDLNRAGDGLEIARIQAHQRQIHVLAINPHKPQWLLSASHDGTVKSWDIRTPQQEEKGAYFRPWQTFKCNADAVRDVEWCPTDGFEFACCTDSGQVQKWHISKPGAAVLKISAAHTKSCFSISWHPDGQHIVSGGLDMYCHVWDFSKTADRNQKPRYTFPTISPVAKVSWRPACWSATARGRRAAQVTVAYEDSNSRNLTSSIHVWDLARSSWPFKEINQLDSAPTGMLWSKQDLLWTVDRDGYFTQTDVVFIPKLMDSKSLSTFTFSPTGEVLMVLEERPAPRRPRPAVTTPEPSPGYSHDGSGPMLSMSRSDSEEDVVGSFLGPRRKKGHRRRNSGRSNQMSTTPPSVSGVEKVMPLEEAIKVTGVYTSRQVMAIGRAPSTTKKAEYEYYSNCYLMKLAKYPKKDFPNVKIESITEYYARCAADLGHYRLAQTWRILGYTMKLLLTRRAEHHREARLTVREPSKAEEARPEMPQALVPRSEPHSQSDQETPRKSPRPDQMHSPFRGAKVLISEESESTSNVATPLVRPIRDHIAHETREAMHTPMIEDDEFRLPDAVHPKTPNPIPVPGAKQSPVNSTSSVEGYDFYGMESFSPAIDFAAPPRKQPLRLDYNENQETVSRMQIQRHDSGESFEMFSTSADSRKGRFMGSDGSDGNTDEQRQSFRERVTTWEKYHVGGKRSSMDSDAATGSATGFTPDSDVVDRSHHHDITSSPPVFLLQEASAPRPDDVLRSEAPLSPTSSPKPPLDMNPNLIPSDFEHLPSDPAFLVPSLSPSTLLKQTITYHITTLSSALHASAMILLLLPHLPPHTVDPLQALAILRTYHTRLNSMQLFQEATLLRKLCVPAYPEIYGPAQEQVTIGFFCTDCSKPLDPDPNIPGSLWKCSRCKNPIAGCAVCQERYLEPGLYGEDKVELSTWFYCPGCGHGGHVTCMLEWHRNEGEAQSGGCCPLEGCLHPCLPGRRRNERAEEKRVAKEKELGLQVKERGLGIGRGRGQSVGVRRDQREVVQSRAVEGVRAALGGGGSGVGVERKKSVKLVAPGEERGSRSH